MSPDPTDISRGAVSRLWKNTGRYLGETIQIAAVTEEIRAVALKLGWRRECFLQTERLSLEAYHRPVAEAQKRVYISAGIHGDEPAGPLAVLELLKQNEWPDYV